VQRAELVLAVLIAVAALVFIKPMKVDHTVTEGLKALAANRAIIISGRMNRIMRAVLPASLTRSMLARMFEKMPAITESSSLSGTE
jgi:hypothetical protein